VTKKIFESYFLHFRDAGLSSCEYHVNEIHKKEMLGLAHLAIAVGTKELIDSLTPKLKADGSRVISRERLEMAIMKVP
jgi:lactoylglutathione lyase